jgi:hypothetical protein
LTLFQHTSTIKLLNLVLQSNHAEQGAVSSMTGSALNSHCPSQETLTLATGPLPVQREGSSVTLTGPSQSPGGTTDRFDHLALLGVIERLSRRDLEELVGRVVGAVAVGDVRVGARETERNAGDGSWGKWMQRVGR